MSDPESVKVGDTGRNLSELNTIIGGTSGKRKVASPIVNGLRLD